MNKKVFIGIAILCLIILIAFGIKRIVLEKEVPQVTKIGALLPITGPGGIFADYIRKGLDLKVNEINNLSDEFQFQIIYEDSKNQPSVGITSYKKLIDIDKTKIIIPALSSVCKAVGPLANETNSIQIGTAVSFPGYTEISPNIFRFYPNAYSVSGVMAKYFIKNINKNKVGIIYINDEFGKACLETFENTLEIGSLEKSVVFKESYEGGQKDFKQTIEKLNASEAEAVYISGYGPAYPTFIRQLKELGKRDYILMGDMTLGLPSTFSQIGNLLEGAYFVDGNMKKTFIDKYFQQYGELPSTYSGYAYDLIGVVFEAVKKENEKDENIGMALQNISYYNGCMGDSISIDKNREVKLKFVVFKVINGIPTVM